MYKHMYKYKYKFGQILIFILLASLVLTPSVLAETHALPPTEEPTAVNSPGQISLRSAPNASHRLIVELVDPPLAVAYQSQVRGATSNGRLDARSSAAQSYINTLQAKQAAFVSAMQQAMPSARVSTFINEFGVHEEAAYQITLNGITIDPGMDIELAQRRLSKMPGVKAVHLDFAHEPQLYNSVDLINAPVAWNNAAIGGVEGAGAGIKVASMDGGLHKDAPMFDGTDYQYPAGYGPNGLGETSNNNGKIIVSRTYFRSWDPPAPGDENPWPGENGTSHGVHTGSIAAGNQVGVTFAGLDLGNVSGVAPKAYVMSYRLFYASINDNASFHNAEGIAALEDIVRDGADVVNNSWGSGPTSAGGIFDVLDTALINASKAGVFVSMSTGNAGPGGGTSSHASSEYINVAASTTSSSLASGRVVVPGSELGDVPYGDAAFGTIIPLGQSFSYSFVTAASVDPSNTEGCNAWPTDTFMGKAVLISRGSCFFSDKAYYAEQAGADFVIVYNNDGDGLISMSCGSFCGAGEITIGSISVGQSDGQAMISWHESNGDSSTLEIDTVAYEIAITPDLVSNFSSRGPAVGNILKPDMTAPGVNILAQGYAASTTGEDRHLGFGLASGTSMASPHVAGSAALLRQAHPSWSNAEIKSALMSTAKYMGIYNLDGTPSQPLDIGAGRVDVGAAMDPGVILSPPNLSFGPVPEGEQRTIRVAVTNISDAAESYDISTLYTGDGFTQTTTVPGLTADTASLSLNPGETKTIELTFDAASSNGLGDNQGYLVLTGATHNAHMPMWARVAHAAPLADVLIIDNDFSDGLATYDYLWYYTSALDELGYSYHVINVDDNIALAETIPSPTTLAAYRAIIHFTGDNYQPNGTFSVPTGLTRFDKDHLIEYLNGGGLILAMGQDLAAALGASGTDLAISDLYYNFGLGANYIQDSISGNETPTQLISAAPQAPRAFNEIFIDLTQPRKMVADALLSGENEVPAIDTSTLGVALVSYDLDQNLLQYGIQIEVTATNPVTITAAHIHNAVAGENGPVVHDIYGNVVTGSTYVTETFSFVGEVTLSDDEEALLLSESLYINIHSTANPSGELRGQLLPVALNNQIYVDEIDTVAHDGSQEPGDETESYPGVPLLRYSPGTGNLQQGTVAMFHRDQPSLERAGISYYGRSIYTAFGLEGMDSSGPGISRGDFLKLMLDWGWSEASDITINVTENAENVTFSASLGGSSIAASYRWDFGDGSAFTDPIYTSDIVHRYTVCLPYTVRVEVTDTFGNVSIGSVELDPTSCTQSPTAEEESDEPTLDMRVYLPFVGQ